MINATSIEWPARRGVSYEVQRSANLASWFSANAVLSESNGMAGVSIAELAINPSGFFRLAAE